MWRIARKYTLSVYKTCITPPYAFRVSTFLQLCGVVNGVSLTKVLVAHTYLKCNLCARNRYTIITRGNRFYYPSIAYYVHCIICFTSNDTCAKIEI